MSKLPVVIPYVHTNDDGAELRYTLRSLKNIKNWNGEVYVIGDKERWFKDIIYIRQKRQWGRPYDDVINKLKQVPVDDYILMMDDVYITKPTEVVVCTSVWVALPFLFVASPLVVLAAWGISLILTEQL